MYKRNLQAMRVLFAEGPDPLSPYPYQVMVMVAGHIKGGPRVAEDSLRDHQSAAPVPACPHHLVAVLLSHNYEDQFLL